MKAFANYASPLGNIVLSADGEGLTGLGFAPETAEGLSPEAPALRETRRWLGLYFSGRAPGFTPPLHLSGTPFRMEVWALLLEIPYGGTTTYGALAKKLSARRGGARVAAQAVGGAVGRNPVALIVPCHRVVGADGSLVGYGGGLDRKARLLALEGAGLASLSAFL